MRLNWAFTVPEPRRYNNVKSASGVNTKAVAKAADTVECETRFDRIRPSYLEALMLVERLHCLAWRTVCAENLSVWSGEGITLRRPRWARCSSSFWGYWSRRSGRSAGSRLRIPRSDVSWSCFNARCSVGSSSRIAIACSSSSCIGGFHRSWRQWRPSGPRRWCDDIARASAAIGAGNPGTWEAGHQSMRVYGRFSLLIRWMSLHFWFWATAGGNCCRSRWRDIQLPSGWPDRSPRPSPGHRRRPTWCATMTNTNSSRHSYQRRSAASWAGDYAPPPALCLEADQRETDAPNALRLSRDQVTETLGNISVAVINFAQTAAFQRAQAPHYGNGAIKASRR